MFEMLISPQIQYLLALQEFRNYTDGIFNNFFMFITTLGENYILMALIAIIYWAVNKKAGIFLIFNLALSVIINLFIKLTACVNRPWILDTRVSPLQEALPQADGYSFPSGHTARAVGVWGAIAYWWWQNKFIRYISLTIAILIGFSRNYIGVHTPQDVIVSIILGVLIILGLDRILKWENKKHNRDLILFSIAVITGVAIYLFLCIKCTNQMSVYNPAIDITNPLAMKHSEYGKLGFFFGVLLGWIIEKRFINFDNKANFQIAKIALIFLGILTLHFIPAITELFFSQLVPNHILSALTKFITAIFILAIHPFFIKFTLNR